MERWNYPEFGEIKFKGSFEKDELLNSYIRYYMSRLQSMFKWEGLPDTIPQKWLENLLMVGGSCVWVKTDKDGLFVNRPAPGGDLDIYYIPKTVLVVNPYATGLKNKYTRDVDCVLMLSDTYAQGMLPMLRRYCSLMLENTVSLNIASIMSRATMLLSASDDKTRASAELFVKHLFDGKLDVIGEAPFLVSNNDKALTVNQMTHANDTLTQLIEYHQYIKASLYNELGLQSNYNMKRESINSNESQLNEDQLHPLIDNMLEERRIGAEKVNEMFGTNISVNFNSAWSLNERELNAEIETIEKAAESSDPEENTPDGGEPIKEGAEDEENN